MLFQSIVSWKLSAVQWYPWRATSERRLMKLSSCSEVFLACHFRASFHETFQLFRGVLGVPLQSVNACLPGAGVFSKPMVGLVGLAQAAAGGARRGGQTWYAWATVCSSSLETAFEICCWYADTSCKAAADWL